MKTSPSLGVVVDRPWRAGPSLRRLLLPLAAAALGLGSAAAPAAPEPGGAGDGPLARVIVKYKAAGEVMRRAQAARAGGGQAAHGPQQAAAMGLRSGLHLIDGRVIDERRQVLLARGLSSQELALRLAADAELEYAVPDERRRALALPNDPLFAGGPSVSPIVGQWYLREPDAQRVSAMNAVGAWDVTTGAVDVVVAIIDSGVRREHPDLVGSLVDGYDFIADPVDARDGDGRDADPSDPGDWTDDGQCSLGEPAAPSSWHGTKMAGLVGARTDNGLGMASVGRGVRVQPVRALGPCGGYDSDIIAGMLWAAGLSSNPVVNRTPARVLNLSLGSSGACSAAYRDVAGQLEAAGVVVVAAAGNEEGLAVSVPGNCPGVVAVAALRHAGTKVGFSSVGPEVTIAAPGGNCVNLVGDCLYPILTTSDRGSRGPEGPSYTDARDYSVGTSFASPLVAGTVGLMVSANPALSPRQVRERLRASARPFVAGGPGVPQCHAPDSRPQDECACTTSTCGAGMLDAGAAVRAATAGGSSSGGGSGGGALGLPWLAALAAAVLLAFVGSRRTQTPPSEG
ncbi:S8 family peptidase [Rubrivivax sp.]|jgi:serine protease